MNPTYAESARLDAVLDEVIAEVKSSTVTHGDQSHLPDGTGYAQHRLDARLAKNRCETATAQGRVTWQHILDEEVTEAYDETDPARIRAELVQVMATAAKWVLAIDGRTPADTLRDVA